MKFIITGHGADNTGCSEFCSKNYTVLQNGTPLATRAIWRADCGLNHLYPQSGTWVYDRGNWCPGDAVQTHSYALPSAAASTVDVDFDPHTSIGSSLASYTVFGGLVHYGSFNKTLDASLDDIIAPSNHEQHFRQNPTCNTPIIRVSNAGSQPLTSVKFEYGVSATAMATYTWSGTLAPLRDTVISLPRLSDFRGLTGSANMFTVRILQANNASDADATNNELKSTFTAMPEWSANIRIQFKTNNMAGETAWKIFAANGTQIASQSGPAAGTTYTDTVTFVPGCYRMEVTDGGCQGLNWWANPAGGAGTLNVYRLGSTPLILKGYYGGDFGCGFTQYFSVGGTEAITRLPTGGDAAMQVFPNPARASLQILLLRLQDPRGTLIATDALGRMTYTSTIAGNEAQLDVSRWPAGMYTISFTAADGRGKVQAGVVVAH